MDAQYDAKKKVVRIQLRGTPVCGFVKPNPILTSDGLIELTAYGARKFAYELLSAATDCDHYKPKPR